MLMILFGSMENEIYNPAVYLEYIIDQLPDRIKDILGKTAK